MCKNLFAILCIAAFLFCCPTIFQARAHSAEDYQTEGKVIAPTAVQLQSVLSGLSFTVYVTHAHDGTNRLFIIEKAGRIRVAQPGASTATLFLDISSRVLSVDNERGLLGLAFHPQYSINGRFFVYYTRQTDGALTIAEYHVTADPNVADPNSEIVFGGNFPINHSANTNHNGGCMQFGPDGYLYAGTGDGGSGDDPPGNGQNINVLLGKILRIDVDTPNGAIHYSSPPTNPFFGATPGADEIYAYGMRNPWRFSFDRGTGQLYVGDVGQNTREEIDIVTLGHNYGWRVMEGMICNPAFNGGVCTPPTGSILPIFDYTHSAGRCSITGGYVYRGARATLPTGAYVYADYCTGEIWQLQSGVNTLLLDTSRLITSFGEDEAAEVYVVGQNGTIDRLTTNPPPSPCLYMISPTSRLFPAVGTEGTLTLATASDCGWIAAANVDWITFGASNGAGTNVIPFIVRDNLTASPRTAIIHVGGQTFTVVQESSVASECVYTLTPSFQSFPAAGGAGSFNLFTQDGCAWEATPSAESWITINSARVGIGNAIVSFTIGANATGKPRKGTITIANQVFTLKQKP
jgi:glucose/arabinose dehydrogenase